ncbi:rRNA-processing protein FCF1 [Pseudomonas sp. 3296]|uniref:hypothetical protein n=1 Tax=Pseudomonas sp. 3296 TaxID=2817753 RepID=UPI002864067F|nr:hypothetical protein [Pseudomonas sp. 3296]MDR6918724.1 rRNA-processing protein FCF1 [Pseudomonas sp. 3296]
MSDLDRFSRGLTKAFERRRALQQQTMQQTQIVEKTDDDSDAIITNTKTNTLSNDEQYKQTIVQNMIALIHKRKTK